MVPTTTLSGVVRRWISAAPRAAPPGQRRPGPSTRGPRRRAAGGCPPRPSSAGSRPLDRPADLPPRRSGCADRAGGRRDGPACRRPDHPAAAGLPAVPWVGGGDRAAVEFRAGRVAEQPRLGRPRSGDRPGIRSSHMVSFFRGTTADRMTCGPAAGWCRRFGVSAVASGDRRLVPAAFHGVSEARRRRSADAKSVSRATRLTRYRPAGRRKGRRGTRRTRTDRSRRPDR